MTRRLVALALGALALLSYLAQATPTPTITVDQAGRWEGQAVVVRGVVRDLRLGDGVRFDLVADGHALPVRGEAKAQLRDGQWMEARGRLARLHGDLALLADGVRPAPAEEGLAVSLAALALDPDLWHDTPVRVHGVVEKGALRGDGQRIALGDGPWPSHGPVTAEALLRYEAACACHRLDRIAA